MKRLKISYILKTTAFSLGLLLALPVCAKVAKPGLIEAAQPDGTKISIRLEGNFHNKAAFSEDGYQLAFDAEGYYVVAQLDENGNMVPSDIRAINPEQRDPQTIKRLEKIDRDAVRNAFLNHKVKKSNLATRGPGTFSSTCPALGKQRGIAILAEFDDLPFTIENPKDFFYRMLNEENFSDNGATGSAADYYKENSHGLFEPEFDVYGPVTLSKGYSYYGGNTSWGDEPNSARMISEACSLINDEVNFADYDLNEDGYVDMVYVIYAGYGEADGGPADSVWPHSWTLTEGIGWPLRKDDVIIDSYACSNELQFGLDIPDGIGAFVHEFGHVLGLADLYNTSYNSGPFTPGAWDVMDAGSYNNNSHTPPCMSAFERYALDWLEPTVLDSEQDIQLLPLSEHNQAYILPTENENEFFLFEYRRKTGFDKYIPAEGMLVWHIDFVQDVWDWNQVNTTKNHQYVDIIEADQKQTSRTVKGDCFPGSSDVTELTPFSDKSYMTWEKVYPEFSIKNIVHDGETITFTAVETLSLPEAAGIETITGDGGFLIVKGRNVSCRKGVAEIYDISGRKVAVVGENSCALAPGLYLARSKGSAQKFLIR